MTHLYSKLHKNFWNLTLLCAKFYYVGYLASFTCCILAFYSFTAFTKGRTQLSDRQEEKKKGIFVRFFLFLRLKIHRGK